MKKEKQTKIASSYQWQTVGDSSNPIIALIATSSGLGQVDIQNKISALVAAGFCVKYVRYSDGSLVNQHNDGNEMVREAVDPKIGAEQIIDCINNGWNMMPTMGGWSFQNKVPFVVDYFEKNPDQKNLAVKMFGFSDNTFATILQSNGICQFICSTALYCLLRQSPARFAPVEIEKYQIAAQELVDLLRTGKVVLEPRTILFNPDNKLDSLEEFEFYPMHCGNPFHSLTIDENDEQYDLRHLDSSFFEPSEKYAIALEGFIQRPGALISCNENADQLLDRFLAQKQQQGKLLPECIEINLFTTRLDGEAGYHYLVYDQDSGLIEKSAFNIEKLLKNQSKIKATLLEISKGQKSSNDAYTKVDSELLDRVRSGEDLNKEDITKLIDSENKQIEILQEKILAVAQKYNIPVIQNFRFGHSLNMSTVGGGRNKGSVMKDGSFAIEHIEASRPLAAQSSNQLSQNTTQFQIP
ncbi:MAG: hypothetical protein V4612_00195 [Pseudomonadota bacterium]